MSSDNYAPNTSPDFQSQQGRPGDSLSYPAFPRLNNELERIEALHSYHILDTAEDADFDELTTLASAICNVPVSLISLVDKDRQWFKSHKGVDIRQTSRELSFCAYAIADPGNVMVVPDLSIDSRFAANPLVTGETNIIFYAGVPLVNQDGFALGTLCVVDHEARELSRQQVNSLMILAKQVVDKLELRKKTAALAESKQALELALDAGSLGYFEFNLLTGMANINPQGMIDLVWQNGQAAGLARMISVIIPEHRDHVQVMVKRSIDMNEPFKTEYQVEWPDGSRHWIASSGKIKFDQWGKATHLVGVTQDITLRKELERRKDEFLGVVSHELKTPITSLKASLQLLESFIEDPRGPHLPSLLKKSLGSADRINSLVDDLLNMHRFSEGDLRMTVRHFDIRHLLHTCADDTSVSGSTSIVVGGTGAQLVSADEFRIEQVVRNLINNALKYASSSAEIRLDVSCDGEQVEVSVTDKGPGIPEKHIPHLFERYWRADHWGTTYSGLGLGLYICSEIINRHNGQIGVRSVEGEGSTFWFRLPVISGTPALTV